MARDMIEDEVKLNKLPSHREFMSTQNSFGESNIWKLVR